MGRSTSVANVSGSRSRDASASANQNGPDIETPHAAEAGSPSAVTRPVITNAVGANTTIAIRIATRVDAIRADTASPNATAGASAARSPA